MTDQKTGQKRRTIRRYAHELFPHADEYEVRPLTVEVPYLYARAIGYDTWGTGWRDLTPREHMDRVNGLVQARRSAFIADALLQGLAGDEAWAWADARSWDETDEWAYERAQHYGVDPDRIKPYPCGPEPGKHDHVDPETRVVTVVECRESDCPDCTEPGVMTRAEVRSAR